MYEYMTEYERESAIFNAKLENAFMKIDFAFERAYHEHEIRMNGIEAESYMIESSNELSDMYARENEVFTESLKGVWEGFKKFIGGVLDKIKELLGIASEKAKGSDETVEVPMDVKAAMKDQNKILHVLRNWASFCHPDGKPNTPKILAFIGAGTAVAGGTIYAVMKKKTGGHKGKPQEETSDEVKKDTKTVSDNAEEAKSLLNDMSKNDGKGLSPELKDLFKSVTDSMNATAQALANTAVGKKATGAVKKAALVAYGVGTRVSAMGKNKNDGNSEDSKPKTAKNAIDAFADEPGPAYKAFVKMCGKHGIEPGTMLKPGQITKMANGATEDSERDAIQALRAAGANVLFEHENQQDDADLNGETITESTSNAFNDLMSLIESL